MLLKVGELAKHTGLTVRTLHHYDEIGLLKPSGRSDSGYRLYSQSDVQRLHGIQSLRHLGLALADISGLLDGAGTAPDRIIDQQMLALNRQIAQATELRDRLALMRDGLVAGTQPDMSDWLSTLALMATYGKYFSAAELKRIFANWKLIESEWLPLVAAVRDAMDRGVPHDAPQAQPLATRWMSLMLFWMEGDFDLMERWGHMYREEPVARGHGNGPAPDMVDYITRTIDLRMALLSKYMTQDEIRRAGHVPAHEWAALEATAAGLMQAGVPADSDEARAAARRWGALLGRVIRGDQVLLAKLLRAIASEPLLQAGSQLSAPVRAYLREAAPEIFRPPGLTLT